MRDSEANREYPLSLQHERGGVVNSTDQNKALVRRFYEEIDKGNIAILDELVAEDYLDHNPSPFPTSGSGRERIQQEFKIFQAATPGYHQIEDQIAEGDKVVTRLTSYGKHMKVTSPERQGRAMT